MSDHSRRTRKCLVLLIVAIALWVGASVVVHASSGIGNGSFVIPGGPRVEVGTKSGASDLSDSYDALAILGTGWNAGVYHAQIDGWDGTDGFYRNDYRAPLLPGESKSWVVYFWAANGSTPSNASLGFNWSLNSGPDVVGKVEYIQAPQGIVGGPEVGTVWTTAGDHWVQLPYYSTSDGLTGYAFKLTLTAVPEPSSILALAGGIAGLGGFVLRRRKV